MLVSGLDSVVKVDALFVVSSYFVVVIIFVSVSLSVVASSEFFVGLVLSVDSVVVEVVIRTVVGGRGGYSSQMYESDSFCRTVVTQGSVCTISITRL